jgi:hypothetical protein
MARNGDTVHGVDEILPPPKLATLGLQHVLVMYAGAVAVPLIIAGTLGLPPGQRAILISSDILACGLATLVQSIGFPYVGIRGLGERTQAPRPTRSASPKRFTLNGAQSNDRRHPFTTPGDPFILHLYAALAAKERTMMSV